MSDETALVPVTLSTLPATGALALARGEGLLLAGVTQASVAPQDDDDFADVDFRPKVLQANGQDGMFKDRDKPKTEDGPRETAGVAVVVNQTQNLFRPNKQKVDTYNLYGIGKVLQDGDHKWICACSDKRPVQRGGAAPRLNPALTPDQVEAAKQAGIGGATGQGCIGCKMATKDWLESEGVRVAPPCTPGVALAWLDHKVGEPAVLRMLGESARNFLAVVARKLKLGKRSLWPFTYLLRLVYRKRTDEDRGLAYWSVDTEIRDKVPESEYPRFLEARQNLMTLVREVTESDDDHLETLAEQEEAAHAAAASSGGRTVDYDVNEPPSSFGWDNDGNPSYLNKDDIPF